MSDATQALATLRITVEGVIARLQSLQGLGGSSGSPETTDRMAALTDEIQELGAEVERTGAAVSAAGERAAASLAAAQAFVVSASEDSVEGGETALQCLDEQCDELSAAVAQAREAFAASITQLTQATRSHAEQFKAAARDSLFDPLRSIFADVLERGDSTHLEQLDALLRDIESSMQRLADLLVEALTALAELLNDSAANSSGERAALEPALEAVKVVLDPLLEEVERVKDLASMVGIDV